MKKYFSILALFSSVSSFAWDGTANGKIGLIEVETGSAYSFRVWLDNDQALCGNTNKWAYVSYENPNYQAYVSVLLSAKIAEKQVTIFANRRSQDFCEIGHIQLR